MSVPTRPLLLLLLVSMVAGLLQFDGFAQRAQSQQSESVIRPEVLEALQSDAEVAVFISLAAPAAPLAEVSISDLRQNTAMRQARVLSALDHSDFNVTYQYDSIPALAGRMTAAGVDKLARHADVRAVSLDFEISITLEESVPQIGADAVQLAGLDGTGVDIAVMDTGIDTDHEDLIDSILGEACFLEASGAPCGPPEHPAEDDNIILGQTGHGTHVSGIITSNGDNGIAPRGVAPNADIFAYKVVNALGGGDFSDWAAALNDIIDRNADPAQEDIEFINMSLGDNEVYPAGTCRDEPAANVALTFLWLFGTVTFASSGNDADKSGITWPACVDIVVSVGAVYDADVGEWTALCNDPTTTADQVACFSNSSEDLDLLAPGSKILSTAAVPPGTASKSGTSMASPHAVGVAALLKQVLPGLNVSADLLDILKKSGVPVTDDFDPANVRTTPRVDARAAVLDDDFDKDGCTNGQEFGDDPNDGGLRDPEYFWDFYDVWTQSGGGFVRDRVITIFDILMVADHFGSSGIFLSKQAALVNALTPPANEFVYSAAYDRSPLIGPNPWDTGPPDSVISIPDDILRIAGHFGHGCFIP